MDSYGLAISSMTILSCIRVSINQDIHAGINEEQIVLKFHKGSLFVLDFILFPESKTVFPPAAGAIWRDILKLKRKAFAMYGKAVEP